MKNLIRIVFDKSSREETFLCNITKKELEKSYREGCKVLEFDILKCLRTQNYKFSGYQLNAITVLMPQWLIPDYIPVASLDVNHHSELPYYYLFVAAIGNPELRFTWAPGYEHTIDLDENHP